MVMYSLMGDEIKNFDQDEIDDIVEAIKHQPDIQRALYNDAGR
jgi:hypothetical protein